MIRMKRQQIILLFCFLIAVPLALVMLWSVYDERTPIEDRLNLLKIGMADDEVVAIIGPPATQGDKFCLIGGGLHGPDWTKLTISTWNVRDGCVHVGFDDDRKLAAFCRSYELEPPSFWRRIRRQLLPREYW
jgi:hypothetical protein